MRLKKIVSNSMLTPLLFNLYLIGYGAASARLFFSEFIRYIFLSFSFFIIYVLLFVQKKLTDAKRLVEKAIIDGSRQVPEIT